MSSMTSASALPAPGPGTVRLTLVRHGIEHFGMQDTQQVLFPIIRVMRIAIRPPERVAFTVQPLHLYKVDDKKYNDHLVESIGYREFAHAAGPMTIYVEVPTTYQATFRDLLSVIGYWGQTSSLAQCLGVEHSEPVRSECAVPLEEISGYKPLRAFFTSMVSDFRDQGVQWHHIMPDPVGNVNDAIRIKLYVWPMRIIEQRGDNRLLLRCSITERSQ